MSLISYLPERTIPINLRNIDDPAESSLTPPVSLPKSPEPHHVTKPTGLLPEIPHPSPFTPYNNHPLALCRNMQLEEGRRKRPVTR
jgi:hypothetical protein